MLCCIIPFEADTGKIFTFPVFSDFVVLFEDIAKVVGVALAYVFNSKIINYQGEEDRAPFVEPEAGSSDCFILASFVETFLEEFIGKLAF